MTTGVTVQSATASAPSKKATAPKTVKKSSHPVYADMVKKAIVELKEKKGSSKPAILKYIMAHYNLGDKNINSVNLHIKQALKKGITTGTLKQTTGTGASGSFTITKKAEKKPKVVKKVKKPASEKKAVKKTTTKKVKDAKKPTEAKKAVDTKKTSDVKKSAKSPKAKSGEKKSLKVKKTIEKKSKSTTTKKASAKVVKKSTDAKKKSSTKKVTLVEVI
uniref:Histone H1.X (inferred by orthology to a C. elegans protein) n=1 Tax=Strongyloides venezuelensis TaxID=75913 RepID=A0A0K0EZ16_STRVS